jgi:hypothetical protein
LPTFGALDRPASHGRGEARGPGEVAAHHARMQHLDVGDRPADDVAFKAGADGLDLG